MRIDDTLRVSHKAISLHSNVILSNKNDNSHIHNVITKACFKIMLKTQCFIGSERSSDWLERSSNGLLIVWASVLKLDKWITSILSFWNCSGRISQSNRGWFSNFDWLTNQNPALKTIKVCWTLSNVKSRSHNAFLLVHICFNILLCSTNTGFGIKLMLPVV